MSSGLTTQLIGKDPVLDFLSSPSCITEIKHIYVKTPDGSKVVTRVLRVEKAEDLNVMDGSKLQRLALFLSLRMKNVHKQRNLGSP